MISIQPWSLSTRWTYVRFHITETIGGGNSTWGKCVTVKNRIRVKVRKTNERMKMERTGIEKTKENLPDDI